MMTKRKAQLWANDCAHNGTGNARTDYRNTHRIGTMAETHWHDELFTLGVEYGILIAVDKIFNEDKKS